MAGLEMPSVPAASLAASLELSPRTVREHLKNALDKLLPEIVKSEQAAWLRAALPPAQVAQGEARRP
jgi:DNA-binding NarL/FixJ family response regulator